MQLRTIDSKIVAAKLHVVKMKTNVATSHWCHWWKEFEFKIYGISFVTAITFKQNSSFPYCQKPDYLFPFFLKHVHPFSQWLQLKKGGGKRVQSSPNYSSIKVRSNNDFQTTIEKRENLVQKTFVRKLLVGKAKSIFWPKVFHHLKIEIGWRTSEGNTTITIKQNLRNKNNASQDLKLCVHLRHVTHKTDKNC